jgi:mannonate dehydratase
MNVRLGFRMGWNEDRKWRLARQLGLDTVMTAPWYERNESGSQPWSFMPMLHAQQKFADFGLELMVVSPPPMDEIRLGTEEKEPEYEDLFELIETMGALKIPVLCYNFNAVLHATRTSVTTKGRGGALVTSYDDRLMQHAPMTHVGKVDDELLWDNLHEFLERTVPVAEANNVKLALHPDDPPIPRLRGIARIIRSEDALKRVLDLVPSKANGLTFCQGTMSTMGVDVPAAIRYFGSRGAIHFVHFRDVKGRPTKFEETFHDDGQTDMYEALRAYAEIGFDGPMRPDHAPVMDGEDNSDPMYMDLGRLYAIGYIRGMLEGVNHQSKTGSSPVNASGAI